MVRQRGYAICTQPRSGSNLLCQVLSSTDQLGYPLEYFNGPGRRALGLPDFPDDPKLQIEAVLRLGATPNGVYAVKLFASQFATFSRRLRWIDLLPNLHFVYLSRDDLLGQAISWVRALQTEQYRSSLAMLPQHPDVMHLQHITPALMALVAFPDVPAVFTCHSATIEVEVPRLHPQIRRYVAVDDLPCALRGARDTRRPPLGNLECRGSGTLQGASALAA
jgi:LPS sulfotransferase NodH